MPYTKRVRKIDHVSLTRFVYLLLTVSFSQEPEPKQHSARMFQVSAMSRPFEVRFNPHTQRVEVLDTVDRLEGVLSQLNTDMTHLTNAIDKIKRNFAA